MLFSPVMGYRIYVDRGDYPSYRVWLSEQEYRLLKKVIVRLLKPYARPDSKLLDLACWDGESTEYYGKQLGIKDLNGFDFFDEPISKARERGVKVSQGDMEVEPFPYADGHFDIVVANQIFEHLKQIYQPLSELHRVLKPGGIAIFSVPNLAASHCRLQLLLGKQPSTIKLFEAHVRGFTPSALKPFLTYNGLFSIQGFTGSGWYPFPPVISETLARIVPGLAVFQLWVLRKERSDGKNWNDEIASRGVQSNF